MARDYDIPENAGDDFNEDHYDIVYWDWIDREWVPFGYEFDAEDIGVRLVAKREARPNGTFRAVQVKRVTQHIDVTELVEKA